VVPGRNGERSIGALPIHEDGASCIAPSGFDENEALAAINAVSAHDKQRRRYPSTDKLNEAFKRATRC
jgi:hypothetical protein